MYITPKKGALGAVLAAGGMAVAIAPAAGAYRLPNSTWSWSGSVSRSVGGQTYQAAFTDKMSLNQYYASCDRATYDGTSTIQNVTGGVTPSQMEMYDKFWVTVFGSGASFSLGGISIGTGTTTRTITSAYRDQKSGTFNYSGAGAVKVHADGVPGVLTGVNHDISGRVFVAGTWYNLPDTNKGDAVC